MAVVPLLAACGGRLPNPFEGGPGEAGVRVRVENQGFNDVRIYALSTGGREALGIVEGNDRRELRLEWQRLDEIRFLIDFMAGESVRTNAVNASPGDLLELFIPENPNQVVLRRRR